MEEESSRQGQNPDDASAEDPGGPAARASKKVTWANRGVNTLQKLGFGRQEVPVSFRLAPNGQVVAKAHWTKSGFTPRPGSEVAYERLGGAGKALGRTGFALSLWTHSVDQWKRDDEQPGTDPVARRARSAYRGAVVAGTSYWGGNAGATAGSILAAAAASSYSAFISGAAIGTMAAPGPGTVVCAVFGGIGGGIAGGMVAAKAANTFVDRTIDPVGSGASAATGRLRERLDSVRAYFS